MDNIESIGIKRVIQDSGSSSFGCGCQCGDKTIENKASNMSGAASACRCFCTDGQATALTEGQSADV